MAEETENRMEDHGLANVVVALSNEKPQRIYFMGEDSDEHKALEMNGDGTFYVRSLSNEQYTAETQKLLTEESTRNSTYRYQPEKTEQPSTS